MKQLLLFFIILMFNSITALAQYNMPTSGLATYTTCSGYFYDDGGTTNDYSTNVDGIVTFYPSTAGAKLSVNFTSFHTYENYDFLYVYNGSDTTAKRIALLTGQSGYGTITSTASDGSLTFKFVSDNSHNPSGLEAGWAATISCNSPPPDTVTMIASGTVTTCGGYFYDGGGPAGDYMIGQDAVLTIHPLNNTDKLSVNFTSFHTYENYDFLYVYNGSDTTAKRIALLTGQSGYGTITSTASDGSLTFKFVSDNSHNPSGLEAGWAATISCNSPPPDTVTMIASGTVTTCGGYFYDGGGPAGDYMIGQDAVLTIHPLNNTDKLSVNFTSFHTYENYDFLYVYNGSDTTAKRIALLTGQSGYGTITSTASDGSLTFKFVSDNSHNPSGLEAGWAATISCNSPPPDTVTMIASGTVTTCGGYFYDGGGPAGDYMIGQDAVLTIHPLNNTDKLSVNFTSFHTYENYDFLYVYNGSDTTAKRIALLTGQSGYGTITSTASDGSLTFKFVSDNSHNPSGLEAGWAATISCNSPPPDTVTMIASGTVTTCGGYFYDGGGPAGDYMIGQDAVLTIHPLNNTDKLSVNFTSFHTYENYDFLYVYNGSDTTAKRIALLTGQSGYGTITSTASDGSLTFKFVSDNSHNPSGLEAGWAATISCNSPPPDTVTMIASGTVTTCGGYFYDGGGPAGDYMIGQDAVLTIHPLNNTDKLSVNFTSFHTYENYDFLYVYNGSDTTTSELLASLTGQFSDSSFTSTASDGSLTFKFVSDNSHNPSGLEAGWVATIACNITPHQSPNTAQSAININWYQGTTPEPIQLGTGTYYYKHGDINIPCINGRLNFTRYYNSLDSNVLGPLGYGWSHSYDYYVINRADTAWDIHYPDGHIATFIPMNSLGQSFPIFSGTTDSLQKNTDDSYSMFTKEKLQYHFDPTGILDSIIDLDKNITRLYYTGNALDSIVAPGGRSIVITYSGNNIASVKDPLNRVCNYGYDGNNNLITAEDANSGSVSFTYDTEHRMLTAVNPLGNIIVNNTYNASGRVVNQKDAYDKATSIVYNFPNSGDATVTNPDNSQMVVHHDNYYRKTNETDELGFTRIFTYDTNSNETGFTNEDNQSETRLFDNAGNLLSDTLPGSKITNITYNRFNSPVQITDAKGNQKIFYYDSIHNNLDSIRNPDNSLQVFTYNTKGQIVQSIDGNGNATSFTYSARGDLLTIQTFAGLKQFVFDAAGRKTSVIDENGHTTTYQYDNNDNLIKITDPLGRTIENTYDANNQLISVKDKKGFITSYTYDKKGRKITSTNPKGGVTNYTYDVVDNLISVTDPDNHVTSYTYDQKGRKTSATNALGTIQYQYDGVGNLIKIIDATNKTTEYTYTATNKKQSQKDGLGNTANYSYDLNDNLASVTDPLNSVTTYGYDDMNRLVSVKDATNKTSTITYDKNGNKKTLTDPNGHLQTYSYDAANRMVTFQDAAGNNYSYNYDSAGNIKTLTKPTGTIGKVFDAANRVITVNNSTGDTYHFTYDNNDNVIAMSNNAGTSNMTYDSLNQLKQYQDPFNKTVSFTYDVAGNKTSVIYPGSKTVSYSYDNANNLKSVTDWLSHTFTYSYDAAGRTTQLLYPNAAHCNYGFDNAGRLISKMNSLSNDSVITGSTFTLDANGERVTEQRKGPTPSSLLPESRAYTYGNDDRMLSDSVWNYVNDNSGNRTSETNGTKTANYTFSVDNLLNSWADTTGNTTNFSYDPLGHRISKVAGANTDRYVLDISNSLSQVLQITDGSGVVKSNYVYGLGLLESIDAANNPLYYHFDAQHNTVALTDPSGVIKDTYTYDPFGTMFNHTGTTTQPFTFLGEYGVERESSALYFARARYYDASHGRFLSKDEFPYDLNNPQTIDRYVYSLNNPIVKYDPYGLFSWSSAGVALLQLAVAAGDISQVVLAIKAAPAAGSILGPKLIFSAASSFNDATKNFQASFANFEKAFNSNSQWSSSDDFTGALDFAFNDPTISLADKVNNVLSGIESGINIFTDASKAFSGIETSNYSIIQKNTFLQHFFLGPNSPFLLLEDIRQGIETLSLSIYPLFNNNSCK